MYILMRHSFYCYMIDLCPEQEKERIKIDNVESFKV